MSKSLFDLSFDKSSIYVPRFDHLDPEFYINKIRDRIPKEVIKDYRTALSILDNPPENLREQIKADAVEFSWWDKFLGLFILAAKENNSELHFNPCFAELAHQYPKAVVRSLDVAVIFNSWEYLRVFLCMLDVETLLHLMSVAAVTNMEMFKRILDYCTQDKIMSEMTRSLKVEKEGVFEITKKDPLFWSIRVNNNEAMYLLLNKYKFDPNYCSDRISGPGYLFYAIRLKNIEALHALIKNGANVNCSSYAMNTPLHCALENEALEMAWALIRAGADIYAKNNKDKMPIDYIKDPALKEKIILFYEENKIKKNNIVIGEGEKKITDVEPMLTGDKQDKVTDSSENISLSFAGPAASKVIAEKVSIESGTPIRFFNPRSAEESANNLIRYKSYEKK